MFLRDSARAPGPCVGCAVTNASNSAEICHERSPDDAIPPSYGPHFPRSVRPGCSSDVEERTTRGCAASRCDTFSKRSLRTGAGSLALAAPRPAPLHVGSYYYCHSRPPSGCRGASLTCGASPAATPVPRHQRRRPLPLQGARNRRGGASTLSATSQERAPRALPHLSWGALRQTTPGGARARRPGRSARRRRRQRPTDCASLRTGRELAPRACAARPGLRHSEGTAD